MEFVRRLDDCPEARKDLNQASILGHRGKGVRRVRMEADVLVRRLQSVSPGSSGMQMRVAAPSGGADSRTLPGAALVGRVLRIEHEGRDLRLGGGPLTWLTSVLRRFF